MTLNSAPASPFSYSCKGTLTVKTVKILHKLSEPDLAAGSGSAGMSCVCLRYVLFWIFSFFILFSYVTGTKKEIWKFRNSHCQVMVALCLHFITWLSGLVSWLESQQLLLYQGTALSDSPDTALSPGSLLAQVLIGTIFCPHLLGATCSVPLEPPGGALHSTAMTSWGRFTQVDSKLVIANTNFQCWVLLYSGI